MLSRTSFLLFLLVLLTACGGEDGDTLVIPDDQAIQAARSNQNAIDSLEDASDNHGSEISTLANTSELHGTDIAALAISRDEHDQDISGLASRVSQNEDDINDIQAEVSTHNSDISGLIVDTQDNAAAIQAGGGINVVDSLGTTLGKFVGKRDDGNTEMEDGAVHYIGLTSTNYFFYFRSLGGVSTTINKDIHWSEADCAGDAYIEQIAWDSMYALQGYVFLHEYPSANLLYYLPAENRGSGANLDYLSVTNTVGSCTNTSGNTTLLQVFPNNN